MMAHVLLVTDEPVLFEGLNQILSAEGRFKLITNCSGATAQKKKPKAVQPDILLLDWHSGMSFGDIAGLQQRVGDCKPILWVRASSSDLAFQALEHGVRGVVRRTAPADVLLRCLQTVLDGGLWFEEPPQHRMSGVRPPRLTKRETQLVQLLCHGLKNKEVASLLFLGEGTVKVYLSKLFRKLGVRDRLELALYGLQNVAQGDSTPQGELQPVLAGGRQTAARQRNSSTLAPWVMGGFAD